MQHPHHFRDYNIKVAGFGGQGVLLLGQLLTEMGMREGLEVSWLPSYGPEMRSGSAHCHVCLSKERIGSPLISHPDVLIAMNEVSLRKFAHQVVPGGVIIYHRDRLRLTSRYRRHASSACPPRRSLTSSVPPRSPALC
jgi:2-oxoisovalerate ferredoxin oxidoreductase beta subunit